jgi:hypothetical protein
MTPQEATVVNILLGYFAGRAELPPADIVRSLEAHNRLQGGWDEFAVRRQWPYAYEDGGESKKAQTPLPKTKPRAHDPRR